MKPGTRGRSGGACPRRTARNDPTLPRGDEPILWDFGSAARHHKLYCPWLGEERSRAGISTLRGSVEGRAEAVAAKIRAELEAYGRGLPDRPEVVAANKLDLGSPGERLKALSRAVDRDVVPISGVTGEGLSRLVQAIVERL